MKNYKEGDTFDGFGCDVYIPSVGEDGEIKYFKIPEKDADELVYSGWLSSPPSDSPQSPINEN